MDQYVQDMRSLVLVRDALAMAEHTQESLRILEQADQEMLDLASEIGAEAPEPAKDPAYVVPSTAASVTPAQAPGLLHR
jgi:hypothetical protein